MLRAFLLAVSFLHLTALAHAVDCPIGAKVKDASFCPAFRKFRPADTQLDDRVASRLRVARSSETRSIAFVIGISRYKMSGADLPPAKIDFDNLIDFFANNQQFDEVIGLENGNATKAAISYFLDEYLVERSVPFAGKARLVVAYTGHGIREVGGIPGALVLAEAENTSQIANLYSLINLKASLQTLSGAYFHVLALLNACYGAGIFDAALTGGNTTVSSVQGGHAVTAGAIDELVYSLGEPGQGSIFFDSLITGVKTGDADNYPQIQVNAAGVQTRVRTGVTRLGPLIAYLTNEIENVNILRQRRDLDAKAFSAPWTGSIEPFSRRAGGGFFFLSPRTATTISFGLPTVAPPASSGPRTAEVTPSPFPGSGSIFGGNNSAFRNPGSIFEDAMARSVPDSTVARANPPEAIVRSRPIAVGRAAEAAPSTSGAISSLPRRPDIKIFNPPDEYPVRGVDISKFEGTIDWKAVKRAGIDFAYIRSSGPSGRDPTFAGHWQTTQAVGMLRGAYHVYSYCRPVAEQLELIKSVVPIDGSALPFGIDVETVQQGPEGACAGAKPSADLKNDVLALARGMTERTGKLPLIYGNRIILSKLLDERFDTYMVWLASYTNRGLPDVQLAGKNPWTLWQFTSTASVDGIGNNVDLSAFFGTPEQFARFREGKINVALKASLGDTP